jgi:hypothetical protein
MLLLGFLVVIMCCVLASCNPAMTSLSYLMMMPL